MPYTLLKKSSFLLFFSLAVFCQKKKKLIATQQDISNRASLEYVIDTWEKLRDIPVADPNVRAILNANITIPKGTNWKPIENFQGILLGNSYTITGLEIN
jgi:hypothetical protein